MDIGRIGEVVDFRGRVDLKDGVLAHENGDVGIIGLFLPVVPEIEAGDEEVRWLVVMRVPHASGWKVDRVSWILVVCCRDVDDVWICCLQAIIEILESERIIFAEPVLVANFDVFDVKGLGMTIFGSLCAPICVDRAKAEFELVEGFFEKRVHSCSGGGEFVGICLISIAKRIP